jgi:uncharacterized protein (DUF1499 family)
MVRYLLTLVLSASIIIGSCLFPLWATAADTVQAAPSMAMLPRLSQVFRGKAPQNLGVHNGKLAPCLTAGNCVVSQNAPSDRTIAPIAYHTDRPTAKKILLQVLQVVPRTTIVESTADYIRVESTSRLLGFVDDAEFYLPETEKVIHVRSASRLGESDLGVNCRRLEQIRLALKDLGI